MLADNGPGQALKNHFGPHVPPLPTPLPYSSSALPATPPVGPRKLACRCLGGAGIPEMGGLMEPGTLLLFGEVNRPPTGKQGDQDSHLAL